MFIVTMVFELSESIIGEELIGVTESGNEALGMISCHDLKGFIQEEYNQEIYLGYRRPEVIAGGKCVYGETVHFSVANSNEGGTVIYNIWAVTSKKEES